MKTKKITSIAILTLAMALVLLPAAKAVTFPTLPPGTITLVLGGPIGSGNWPRTVTFADIPAGTYDVSNGVPYTGWCAQFDADIDPGVSYPVTLVDRSSGIPTPWDKINYLLNFNDGIGMNIQIAMWRLLGYTEGEIVARYGQAAFDASATNYNNANTLGGGFVPGTGQLIAVECVTEPPIGTDEDPQDLIIQLTIPCEGEGLTPGFWKNHPEAWVGTGYSPETSLDDPFNNPAGPVVLGDWTMLEALSFPGGPGVAGAERILLRAAVAALLNSASLDYPLTTAEVISQVNAALASNNRGTILALALELDINNNLGAS